MRFICLALYIKLKVVWNLDLECGIHGSVATIGKRIMVVDQLETANSCFCQTLLQGSDRPIGVHMGAAMARVSHLLLILG